MLARTLTFLTALMSAPMYLWSAVIISNPVVTDGVHTVFPGFGNIDGIKGIGFTMGANSLTLDSVELRLCFSDQPDGCFANSDGTVGTPVVRLFSEAGGDPADELVTFTNPVFALGTADYTFTPDVPFTLLAGTSYWVVLHSADGGEFAWKANEPQTVPSGPFATHLGIRAGGDAPDPPDSTAVFNNIYQVNGTLVPEPSTTLLGLAGATVLLIARRRTRRTTASYVHGKSC